MLLINLRLLQCNCQFLTACRHAATLAGDEGSAYGADHEQCGCKLRDPVTSSCSKGFGL
jgi:hypothetical protein